MSDEEVLRRFDEITSRAYTAGDTRRMLGLVGEVGPVLIRCDGDNDGLSAWFKRMRRDDDGTARGDE